MINELIAEPNFKIQGVFWWAGSEEISPTDLSVMDNLKLVVSAGEAISFKFEGVMIDTDQKFELFLFNNQELIENNILQFMCIVELSLRGEHYPIVYQEIYQWTRQEKLSFLGLADYDSNLLELVEILLLMESWTSE